MPISERHKEIKRRRHRRQKVAKIKKRLESATVSEKTGLAEKLRSLTPGAETIIEQLELEKR